MKIENTKDSRLGAIAGIRAYPKSIPAFIIQREAKFFYSIVWHSCYLYFDTHKCYKGFCGIFHCAIYSDEAACLSTKLFASYLYQPYTFYMNENSSKLSNNIISEVDNIIKGFLFPWLEMVSRFIVVIFIIVLLFIVNPHIAGIATVSLVLSYIIMYSIIRNRVWVSNTTF